MPERILRIGVDIDDVLFHTAQRLIDMYNQKFGTSLTLDDWYVHSSDPEYWKTVWATKDGPALVSQIVELNGSDEFFSVELIDGAFEVLGQLKQQGHQLFAVTGRSEAIRPQTVTLLNMSYPDIFNDGAVFFVDHFEHDGKRASKADVARDLRLTHFIDDLPTHANVVAVAGVKTVLFDPGYPWAKTSVDAAVARMGSWAEIGALLDEEAGR